MRSLLFAAALLALPATAHAQTDRAFLTQAVKGDNSEMTLGRMAEKRAATTGVRRFGMRLRLDHAQAKRDAAATARALSLPVAVGITREAADERGRLQGLSGRAFDREFVRYMVEDHRKDIAEFEERARRGGAAGRLAARTLPALHKHLRTAETLQRQLGA